MHQCRDGAIGARPEIAEDFGRAGADARVAISKRSGELIRGTHFAKRALDFGVVIAQGED